MIFVEFRKFLLMLSLDFVSVVSDIFLVVVEFFSQFVLYDFDYDLWWSLVCSLRIFHQG